MEVYMLKNQEFKTLTVQEIITAVNSRESMEFSFIKFYSKVITI